MTPFTKTPLGWPVGGYPAEEGPYNCGVGANVSFARIVVDQHYRACLAAGLKIGGALNESMPGMYEFQIGPCEGVEIGDQLWVARYILARVAEDHNLGLSFDPKPVKGEWSGAGGHLNFSTIEMREEDGFAHIQEAIASLLDSHRKHLKYYGIGNDERLIGCNATSHIDDFRVGVSDRSASVRIPSQTKISGKGYFEDRRPAANIDPYLVGSLMCSTILLRGENFEDQEKHYETWVEETQMTD